MVSIINECRKQGLSEQEILGRLQVEYPKKSSVEANLYGTSTIESKQKYGWLNNTVIFLLLALIAIDVAFFFNLKLLVILFLLGWIIVELHRFNGTVYIQLACGVVSSQVPILSHINSLYYSIFIEALLAVVTILIFYLMRKLFPKYLSFIFVRSRSCNQPV